MMKNSTCSNKLGGLIGLFVLLFMFALPKVQAQTLFSSDASSLNGWNNYALTNKGVNKNYLWHSVIPSAHTGTGQAFINEGNNYYKEAHFQGLYWIEYRLESPVIDLSGCTDNPELSFDMQMRSETGNWDGGLLEFTTDGTNWVQVTNSDLSYNYHGKMTKNPFGASRHYNQQTYAWSLPVKYWQNVVVDLTQFQGNANFQFRFVFFSDQLSNDYGWSLDNILVNADNNPPVVFCPGDISVNSDAGKCGANVNFSATATDKCAVNITYSHSPGSYFPVGSTVVTANAMDNSGNIATCSFTITVNDTELPNISCPFDITVSAAPGQCGAFVTYNIPSATDNCGTGALPTSLPGYTYKGTYKGHTYFLSNTKTDPESAHVAAIALGGHLATISDNAENTFISNFIADNIWIGATDRDQEGVWKWITNEPFTYSNWAPNEPNNAGSGEDWAVINWSGFNPDWNDWYFNATAYYAVEFDGGSITPVLQSGPASGSFFPVGTTTVTYIATDPSGNTATCSFNVTVTDNEAPVTDCQDLTIQLNASGNAFITANQINNGSSDVCGIGSLSISQTDFGCSDIGENSVTLTVTDFYGNKSECVATVTVQDNIAPSIICPANLNIINDAGLCGAVANFTIEALDNCFSGGFTEDFESGASGWTTGSLGGANNWTIQSISGSGVMLGSNMFGVPHSGSSYYGVENSYLMSPIFDASGGGTFNFDFFVNNENGYFDRESVEVSYDGGSSWTQVIGSQLPNHHNTVQSTSFTIPSSLGNSNTRVRFIYYTVDACCGPQGGFFVDNIDFNGGSAVTVTTSHASGSIFPVGTTTVTATATDLSGNSSSCSFDITVTDKEAPLVSCKDVTIQLNASGNATVTANEVHHSSSDNCGIASLSLDKTTFTCSDVGANTVVLTVTDIYNNVSYCSATVTVEDNVAPVVITQDITVQLDVSGNAAITNAMINSGSSDACGILSYALDVTAFDCNDVGNNTVILTVTDNNNNSAAASATVTVEDNIAPFITCPADISVKTDAGVCEAVVIFEATASDNCAAVITYSHLPGSAFQVGETVVTATATDPSGNVASCSFTVKVTDNELPVISGMPADISVVAQPDNCSPSISWNEPVATDNCIVTLSSSHNAGDNFKVGTTTVTYTATDVNGNQESESFTITVTPTPVVVTYTASGFIGGNNISCHGANDGSIDLLVSGGCEPYVYSWSNGANTENVSGLSAGSYSVTITDANHTSITEQITLTQPAPHTVDAGNNQTVHHGYTSSYNTATLTATNVGGGTGPYSYSWSNGDTTASITVSPSSTTEYTVTVTDANGCTVSDLVQVCVVNVICGPAKNPKVEICHKGNVTLCVASPAVQAHLNHGDYLGACGTNVPCGIYAKSGDGNDAAIVTGEEDWAHITAYPNPFKDQVNIDFMLHTSGYVIVEVYNMTGQKVAELYNGEVNANEQYILEFDAGNMAAGMYFYKLRTETNEMTGKLLLSH